MYVDPWIVCVECGGRAHLMRDVDPGEDWEPGDVATYRCEDCRDRFDIVVGGDDPDVEGPGRSDLVPD